MTSPRLRGQGTPCPSLQPHSTQPVALSTATSSPVPCAAYCPAVRMTCWSAVPLTVAALASACGTPALPPAHTAAAAAQATVALPSDAVPLASASPGPMSPTGPQDVVRAYVAAVNRHDLNAAYALMSPEFARHMRAVVDGLANVVAMTDVRLGTPREEPGAGTTAAAYRHAVFVPVTFTLRQRAATSMHDGPTAWGYLLARNTAADPWMIVDQGPI
jgi:hypothetical protein